MWDRTLGPHLVVVFAGKGGVVVSGRSYKVGSRRKAAAWQGSVQRSSRVRSVGFAEQQKRWAVVWGWELHSGQLGSTLESSRARYVFRKRE